MKKKHAQFKNNLFHYQWFFDENILHEKTMFNDQSVLADVMTFPNFGGFLFFIAFVVFHLKFHAKISPIISFSKYVFHFSYFVMDINLIQIYLARTETSSYVETF
jgi:hypothetical protein